MPLRKVAGNWHYRFQVAGQVFTGNTGYKATRPERSAAQQVELDARRMVIDGKAHLLRVVPKPFNEAMESFLTWSAGEHRDKPETTRRQRISSACLIKFFGRRPIGSITAGDVEDFKAWRRSQQIKEVTIRHDLHTLSPLLAYARKHGWTGQQTNPLADVQIPSDKDAVRMYILSRQEEALYFAECLKRGYANLHDLGRLMIEQGCRPEEVLRLEERDVELDRGSLRIREGKTRAARRTLRLTTGSSSILAVRSSLPSRWIFPSPRRRGEHLTKLNGVHERVLEATGLDFVLYDLRHTFATRAAQAGVDLATLAAILGHSSIRSVMRYVHISQGHQDAAMERLDGLWKQREAIPESDQDTVH